MVSAVVLAGLTLFLGLTQTGSGDSSRVVGKVTSGPHGAPASKAWVTATSASQIVQTQTDNRGRYAFLTLLPGVYRIWAEPAWRGAMYDIRMTGRT
ncbi:MAG: carboxypeptidase regulatory-like domain-containing protein, partial [Candidatus Eremiobacteraeota bacterium]|nr:carboxypeptidase regulatory-like domain-containing protein [Candidatus Eremiobacteraeota bacterium]